MKSELNKKYKENKSAKVGTEIVCPICGKSFIKKQYSQAFCCGKCKDNFWNKKGDRHADPNYHSKYNAAHPERLERVSCKSGNSGNEFDLFGCRENLLSPESFFNPTLGELLKYKCDCEWHDDDWCENQ